MLWPCSGPKSRVRRINMSSVPWRRSTRVCFPALFSLDITPPVDFRPEYPAAQVECQWEMGRMSMGEANFRPAHAPGVYFIGNFPLTRTGWELKGVRRYGTGSVSHWFPHKSNDAFASRRDSGY